MPRYVAFLRGVSPVNAKMAELKRCFESAGFTEVKTVLSSGNVVFTSPSKSVSQIERKAEAAMQEGLGHTFHTIVRPVDALKKMLDSEPYSKFKLKSGAKRVVTFLRGPGKLPRLPIEKDGACILAANDREVFSAYVPGPKGPVFMSLIEKTCGKEVTTRTWETVVKCAKA